MTVDVLGLDLSLSASGVVTADGARTTLTPPTKDTTDRLEWYYRQFYALVQDLDVLNTVLMVEQPFVMGKAHGNTTLDLGEMYGAFRLATKRFVRRIVWVPPATLKVYATGSGSATKPDLRVELFKRAGLDVKDDNQVDAWWLRAMGLDRFGAPPLALPQSHRRALANIKWPGG